MIKQQVGFPFAEIAKEEGIEKAKAFYLQTKNDSTQRKYFLWKEDDGAMVYPGYLLADQGLLNEALEVFKYNLELNPTSSYAYAHVGVVYAKLGNTDLAKVALKKSLKIDPSNKYSIAELKKLKKRN